MEKILRDRLNHLRSKYQEITHVKLTKTINLEKANKLSAQIEELMWILNKYNTYKKLNEK